MTMRRSRLLATEKGVAVSVAEAAIAEPEAIALATATATTVFFRIAFIFAVTPDLRFSAGDRLFSKVFGWGVDNPCAAVFSTVPIRRGTRAIFCAWSHRSYCFDWLFRLIWVSAVMSL